MPRATTTKLYSTFIKGLITEADPLTYPDNASIDEDNCIIYRTGKRSRRLGVNFEASYALSDFSINPTSLANNALTEYLWESVANESTVNFLVQQIGSIIYFYDASSNPISTNRKSFTVDLSAHSVSGVSNPEQSEVVMVNGKGYLFVVGEKIEPFYVTYTLATDSITTTRIYIQIRDFKGVDDGLANSEEPVTLTNLHNYNLRNQGWISPSSSDGTPVTVITYDDFGAYTSFEAPAAKPIDDFHTKFGRYPPNNKQWWIAKKTTTGSDNGNFDPALLDKFYFGNNRAPRGHFLVNAFFVDRSAASGVSDIPVESTTHRPNCVSFYSGRVWYAVDSTIYFSQVLDDKSKAGSCYQAADPTAEDISDLIATDGGVIPIPEMISAQWLLPMGTGLFVFATNGVWFVSGTSAGFSAVELSVTKVSSIGTNSPRSIVESDGVVFWWSKIGIQMMKPQTGMFGGVASSFDRNNISETTIQTFYNNIHESAKRYIKGIFDPATNTIQWLFKTEEVAPNYLYNRILNLNLTLSAFYPWTISSIDGPFISGVFKTPSINALTETEGVVASGLDVITHTSIPVVDSVTQSTFFPTFLKYICVVPNEDENFQVTFADFNNSEFADWKDFDSIGFNYISYIETGYELLEDAMRDKQTVYVTCHFEQTGELWVAQEDGSYIIDKPSSCLFQAKWDWSNSAVSNRWTSKIEAYRLSRVPFVNVSDLTFNTGFRTVVTKNKVRGHGKAIQFRFESNGIGNGFELLGWGVLYSGNTLP